MASRCCWGFCMALCRPPGTHDGRLAPAGHDRRVLRPVCALGRATAWMAPTAIGIITTGHAVQSPGCGVRAVLPGARLCLLWRVARERAAIEEGCHDHGHREFKLPADIDAKKAANSSRARRPSIAA